VLRAHILTIASRDSLWTALSTKVQLPVLPIQNIIRLTHCVLVAMSVVDLSVPCQISKTKPDTRKILSLL